jgi:nucleoside-diphosphate-sugar epimerase
MNKEMLHVQVIRQNFTQIYLLAAILSATGEKNPNSAWNLNMTGLLNVLDIAREEKIKKGLLAEVQLLYSGPLRQSKIARKQLLLNPSLYMVFSKYAGKFWC